MKEHWLSEELSRIESMESRYEWVADLVKPGDLAEDPGSSARDYMAALRGLERCMELRLKLIREYGRLPSEEEDEPLATVDLSRLSDDALEEVEAALIPVEEVPTVDPTPSVERVASTESISEVRDSPPASCSAVPSEKRKDESCEKRTKPRSEEAAACVRRGQGKGRRPAIPSSG
ncbi:MAG: hypothetical protein K2G93_01250 [Rikenella sp.]|nr:hypothetical protein [Rikenella sp.]